MKEKSKIDGIAYTAYLLDGFDKHRADLDVLLDRIRSDAAEIATLKLENELLRHYITSRMLGEEGA